MTRRKKSEIEVKVGRIGGTLQEVLLNGDRTVADALEAASLSVKSTESVRVNSEPAELDDELEDGDRVTLVKEIRGGR